MLAVLRRRVDFNFMHENSQRDSRVRIGWGGMVSCPSSVLLHPPLRSRTNQSSLQLSTTHRSHASLLVMQGRLVDFDLDMKRGTQLAGYSRWILGFVSDRDVGLRTTDLFINLMLCSRHDAAIKRSEQTFGFVRKGVRKRGGKREELRWGCRWRGGRVIPHCQRRACE
ncbi:hypothetical protein BDQ17DRAFT_884945 [Cyathus striatus]|nr:hypothetical protein BDQ17DRAFT_884945 [Cyathus striatus]